MSGEAEDELARTATAPGGASAESLALGATLGRYRLERELGSGGMGVVHAAFDPDLERRVALKVLRSVAGDDASRARLLREARAMARLSHPNVITVHEVGSAAGRDYVAMELIDGQSLAEWLRERTRSEADVLEAFLDAGKGLAAAHAAGIVHRDFKPHNVLRSRKGKIVVTDFGLARSTEGVSPASDPMAETQPLRASHLARTATPVATRPTSSSAPLAGLTVTGTILGTPAYMAPEQWRGSAVSPATDQFAYCVALWEALTGKRPFEGTTIEALRAAIERGPRDLDASKLPRRLRAPILRGLAPEPAQRFPSMDALLAAIARSERRPALAYAAVGAVLVAAATTGIVLATRSSPDATGVVPCAAPVLDPAVVWSEARHDALVARKQPDAARALTRDHAVWLGERTRACRLADDSRPARLRCLDSALGRLDAVAAAVEAVPADARVVEITALLVDPTMCAAPRPPDLLPVTPGVRDTLAVQTLDLLERKHVAPTVTAALVARVQDDACAVARAHLLDADAREPGDREAPMLAAEEAAGRCDDDRIKAEVALHLAAGAASTLSPTARQRFNTAVTAVGRIPQADLSGWLEVLRAQAAFHVGNLDEAIARIREAIATFRTRDLLGAELDASPMLFRAQGQRRSPADLAEVPGALEALRERVIERFGMDHHSMRWLDTMRALDRWSKGDTARAHRELEPLWRSEPAEHPTMLTGRVVDERGKPVSGATVAVGTTLVGTSEAAADWLPFTASDLRRVTTGADGRFTIPDGPATGVAIAQLDDRRSMPVAIAPTLTLVVAPTVAVRGTIDLGGEPAETVVVAAFITDAVGVPYQLIAPVRPDGSFELAHAPRARLKLFSALTSQPLAALPIAEVDTRRGEVTDLAVAMPTAGSALHVVVRSQSSQPIPNARVWLYEGVLTRPTFKELGIELRGQFTKLAMRVDEKSPPSVRAVAKAGDRYATLAKPKAGVFSVCALGLPGELSGAIDKQAMAQPDKIRLECAPVPDGDILVIPTPPWPRLD